MSAEAPVSIVLMFYRATLTNDINYPTTDKDHVLPAGTTGLARYDGPGLVFYPDRVPDGWVYGERSSGRVSLSNLALDREAYTQYVYDIRCDWEAEDAAPVPHFTTETKETR